jgi:hypothetical protein
MIKVVDRDICSGFDRPRSEVLQERTWDMYCTRQGILTSEHDRGSSR